MACKMKKHPPRAAFLLFGILFLFNAVLASVLRIWHSGTWLTYLFGAVLTLIGVFYDFGRRVSPLWLKILFFAGLAAVMTFVGFFYIYGSIDTAAYTEDAVILLGGGTHDSKPKEELKRRLDAAVRYHQKNPDALIVVSGGTDKDEVLSEAEIMKNYLVEKGLPEARILLEEQSTSTNENLRFSKELLQQHLGDDFSVCFISSAYHLYRAKQLSELAGYADATHLHSINPWYTVFPASFREILAVGQLWLLKR